MPTHTVRLHRVLRAASDMQDAGLGWDKGCVVFCLLECSRQIVRTSNECESR